MAIKMPKSIPKPVIVVDDNQLNLNSNLSSGTSSGTTSETTSGTSSRTVPKEAASSGASKKRKNEQARKVRKKKVRTSFVPSKLVSRSNQEKRDEAAELLSDVDYMRVVLRRMGRGSQPKVLKYIADRVAGDKTPVLMKSRMSEELEISEANLRKSLSRLADHGFTKSKGLNGVGGSIFWVNKSFMDNFKDLKKEGLI